MTSSVVTELARLRASLEYEFPVKEPRSKKQPSLRSSPPAPDEPGSESAARMVNQTGEGRKYFLDMAARIKARRAIATAQYREVRVISTDSTVITPTVNSSGEAQSGVWPTTSPLRPISSPLVDDFNDRGMWSGESSAYWPQDTSWTEPQAYYLHGVVGDSLRERLEFKFQLLASELKTRGEVGGDQHIK